jgi:hypothetical protein
MELEIEDYFSAFESEFKSELATPGEKFDEGTKTAKLSVTIDKKPIEYYPWGKDNRLPNKMMEMVRSNGDVGNLLETRADFLYGSGIGLFTRDKKGITTPYYHEKHKDHWMDYGMDDLTDKAMTFLVYTGHAFINVSVGTKKDLSFSVKDSLTVRCQKVPDDVGKVSNYVLSSRWDAGMSTKKQAVLVPAFDYKDFYGLPESIINLHKPQPGQFYYNHPQWWGLEEWIRLANRIAKIYNGTLDTEGNVGQILRVAKKMFDDIMMHPPKNANGKELTRKEVIDEFKKTADKFLFGGERNVVLLDICGVNDKGQLEKYIEFEAVKKSLTGKEYGELYTIALNAISNASGVLGGLSGVSDGKMNSGGGTEIRQTALYQQFYRTPRERKLLLNFLNRVFLKYSREKLGEDVLPNGVFYDFKNIVLETLDKNPTGMQTVKGNAN